MVLHGIALYYNMGLLSIVILLAGTFLPFFDSPALGLHLRPAEFIPVSGSLLPSFPFNVRKSQLRILNFFSRPEDPKCLKYQNVPNLGSFWAIGKPWERFQS